MVVHALPCGSECWAVRNETGQELHAAETRLVRSVKGCTKLDKIRYEDKRKETGVFSANERIRRYRQDRLEHVERTEEGRVIK
jgi:hypothetical protein